MLTSSPIIPDDLSFWQELYSDVTVKRQMYAVPLDAPEFWEYLTLRKTFTVWRETERIGGFTISPNGHIASFGLVVHSRHRGCGYGNAIMCLLESAAKSMGIKTLRADVFEDNAACLQMLDNAGYRPFVWLEKNL